MSEETKHQALAAADVAVSLVDNPQETFGLAVAEAMAAGVPLVVSDWDGYRDLVRDGIDGFRVPTRWASVAQPASVPLGWQQLLGLESYPSVAGALGQLVHFDTQAAEAACLTLLTRSELRRAMGAAARQRACETFHPDVVMSQIEALFWISRTDDNRLLLHRLLASPQLDLVRTFACYASTGEAGSISRQDSEKLTSPSSGSCSSRPCCGIFCGTLCLRNAMTSCGPILLASTATMQT